MFKNSRIIGLVIIALISLLPILWFSSTQIILGHDAGLTLSPLSHFYDRLFAWTVRFGIGNDQTYALPGFFIHGFEALVASFGFSNTFVQKITFIFWFGLPGFTMYYLASNLERKYEVKFFALPAAVIYMVNHFVLQGWFVAERTKFSLYAALPLVVAFLMDWKDKKKSTITTAIFISLTFFVLNGLASLPLFGGLIVVILIFIFIYLVEDISIKGILRLSRLFFATSAISVFLQAYWLIPYANYLMSSYQKSVNFFGGVGGILGWIEYVSENSSYINILRLQGVPEWYQNLKHPYASTFLTNPFLIAVSVFICIAAFLPFLLYKTKKIRPDMIFLGFTALIGTIFIAGSHPPFGAIYILFVKYLPGFIAFRTPFYKFAPAIFFSYSLLIGLTISYICTYLYHKKASFAYGFIIIIVSGTILYSYPFLDGSFFNYIKNERSMKVRVPSYIYDFAKWVDSKDQGNKKILVLPPPNSVNKIEAYTWGYWSLSPLSSLLTNAAILNDSAYMTPSEAAMVEELYLRLKQNDPKWKILAKILGVNTFLMRRDFNWNLADSPTDYPDIYNAFLQSKDVEEIKQFGAWEVYGLKGVSHDEIYASSTLNYISGSEQSMNTISSLPSFHEEIPSYITSQNSVDPSDLKKYVNTYYVIASCVFCDMQWQYIDLSLFTPTLTKDSLIYQFLGKSRNTSTLPADIDSGTIKSLFDKSLVNAVAVTKVLDERKSNAIVLDATRDFTLSINQARSSLQIFQSKGNGVDERFAFELLSILRRERYILIDKQKVLQGYLFGNSQISELAVAYQNAISSIEQTRSLIQESNPIVLDENIKNLSINLPISGNYTLYYRPNDSFVYKQPFVQFTVDEILHDTKISSKSGDWLSLGGMPLSEGRHTIKLQQPMVNQLEQISTSPIRIDSDSNGSCYSSPEIIGRGGDIFKIAFSHRREKGDGRFFVKLLPIDETINFFDSSDELNSTAAPVQYITHYELPQGKKGFRLFVCNSLSTDENAEKSSLILSDILIGKIGVPDMVFVLKGQNGNTTNSVDVVKKDQTNYEVSLPETSGRIVTFNQSYNVNWKMTQDGKHFMANGYANAWILGDDVKKTTILYTPQNLVKLGFGITGITVCIVMGYLFVRRRKK